MHAYISGSSAERAEAALAIKNLAEVNEEARVCGFGVGGLGFRVYGIWGWGFRD